MEEVFLLWKVKVCPENVFFWKKKFPPMLVKNERIWHPKIQNFLPVFAWQPTSMSRIGSVIWRQKNIILNFFCYREVDLSCDVILLSEMPKCRSLNLDFPTLCRCVEMRSNRTNSSKWDPRSLEAVAAGNSTGMVMTGNGYTSSDDDERARLKPGGGGGVEGTAKGSNPLRQYSSGSPNESDNTYAEATLLTGSNMKYDGKENE